MHYKIFFPLTSGLHNQNITEMNYNKKSIRKISKPQTYFQDTANNPIQRALALHHPPETLAAEDRKIIWIAKSIPVLKLIAVT